MKVYFLTLIFFSSINNLFSQSIQTLNGMWVLDKIEMRDTLIISKNRFFTFKDNYYHFGKLKKAPISKGVYKINSDSIILKPEEDISLKGLFHIVFTKDNSIYLQQDTLTLYLTKFYLPSDFTQDSLKSKKEELLGWNTFKKEQFDIALQHFNQSYLYDSTNYNSITGLVFSKGAVLGDIDLNLIDILIKNTEATSWGIGITTAAFVNKYSSKADKEYENEDLQPQIIATAFTGGSFTTFYKNGNPKEKGEYQNNKPIGKWIEYRNDGTIIKTSEYHISDSTKTYSFHKLDGELVTKEIVKIKGSTESTIKKYVYYQEQPDKKGSYMFVSNDGFCFYDNQKQIKFSSKTPDNFIEEVHDIKMGRIWYIWKNGKRTVYRKCELDGIVIWEYQSDKPGKYKWENCIKTFIEPLE